MTNPIDKTDGRRIVALWAVWTFRAYHNKTKPIIVSAYGKWFDTALAIQTFSRQWEYMLISCKIRTQTTRPPSIRLGNDFRTGMFIIRAGGRSR